VGHRGQLHGTGSLAHQSRISDETCPGYQVEVLDSHGKVVPWETEGAVAIKLPLPPGTLPTLWENDQKFKESYLEFFPGYYFTGDGGYYDKDGYIYIMGRIDDVINVAGHRLSTGPWRR